MRSSRSCWRKAEQNMKLMNYAITSHTEVIPAIAARVAEITREAARRTVINKEYLIEKSEELRARGMEIDQLAAAGTAIRELGVLTGHRIERAEIGGPGEFDHLSDDELLAAIEERYARLRGEMQPAISDGS